MRSKAFCACSALAVVVEECVSAVETTACAAVTGNAEVRAGVPPEATAVDGMEVAIERG